MRQLDINGLKTIQLEILDYVTGFCEEHGINYWLDCGTLLGAVRHKGYIPWDDDVDIGMLRDDYDRFMKLFNGSSTRYRFECPETSPDFYQPFGKVMDMNTVLYEPDEKGIKISVYIDVVPYDNIPDDEAEARKVLRKWKMYVICNIARQSRIFQKPKGNIIRRAAVYALRSAVRIFPRNYFTGKIISNAKRSASSQTKRVSNLLGFTKMICARQAFTSLIYGDFEGRKYKIPAGYDEYLRAFYGDYMQFPPPEKRVSTHKFKAYMKEDS